MIKAYPNPFQDWIIIEMELEHTTKLHFEIFDMAGRRLMHFAEQGVQGILKKQLDVSPLSIGRYIILVNDANKKLLSRVSVVKMD
jgi:hypothetical protein